MRNHLALIHLTLSVRASSPANFPRAFDTVNQWAARALVEDGAVIVRNVADNATAFEVGALSLWRLAGFNYVLNDYNRYGSVVRPEFGRQFVYDVASGAPSAKPVQVHSEMAYNDVVPHFVAFGCLEPAASGGELLLSNHSHLTLALPEEFRVRLSRDGVQYRRRLGDRIQSKTWSYASGFWQDRYNTSDFEVAKQSAKLDVRLGGVNGSILDRDDDGTVVLRWIVPAIAVPPGSNRRVLVQAILDNHPSAGYGADGEKPPFDALWSDGSSFTDLEMSSLRAATKAATRTNISLRAGDMVVIDNLRYSHGRLPFVGSRQHLALMSEPVRRSSCVEGGSTPMPQCEAVNFNPIA